MSTGASMAGRTALVTGATRGIGAAIATRLQAEGARVIGTGTRPGSGHPALERCIAVDFADPVALDGFLQEVRDLEPDVVVNNAGINRIAPFESVDLADFMRIQQVNVVAPFRICQAALGGMRRRGWGRIVNISSIWGLISKEQRASYSASKFAVDGVTLALALEMAPHGILANCVAPGFTDTELTRSVLTESQIAGLVATVPARRLAQPAEIAEAVLWLASPANTYVTGQCLAVDGGFTRA